MIKDNQRAKHPSYPAQQHLLHQRIDLGGSGRIEQQAYSQGHPPIGIFRPATEGSQTRNGGMIAFATGPMTVALSDGQRVRVAKTGDTVVYPDGTTAEIISGAGKIGHFADGCSVALVGSHLSNGDEIINTLQGSVNILRCEGIPLPEDFLCLPQIC